MESVQDLIGYHIILLPEAEGGYSAEILEFPGCFSQGDTAEDTMCNIKRAALSWIKSSEDLGHDIPPPITHEYSGKTMLRMSRSIHRRATQIAEHEGVSLNQFLATCVAMYIGEKSNSLPKESH